MVLRIIVVYYQVNTFDLVNYATDKYVFNDISVQDLQLRISTLDWHFPGKADKRKRWNHALKQCEYILISQPLITVKESTAESWQA